MEFGSRAHGMTLYGHFSSAASWRVRIALNLKGLPYRYVPIHLGRGEHHAASYLAMNPQGLLPALKLSDGVVLTQSLAIIEWLEDTHPSPPLLPGPARPCSRLCTGARGGYASASNASRARGTARTRPR
jgi:maleylacetoacetate isomerase